MLAPTRRDGEASLRLLNTANVECVLCANLATLCSGIDGASVLIVPEETVQADFDNALAHALSLQPVWSDLPVIVLARPGVESPAIAKALSTLGNVTLVERPVRLSTLVSAVRAALRARERQCEVRDHLLEQARGTAMRDALIASERAARSEAERVSRMKDEFLATLSHELRTPLNAILGWSQIIKNTPDDAAEVAQGLDVIERNARMQAQIIEDLLDMSRIISGKVRLNVRPLDLSATVQAAVDTARPTADAKGVRLASTIDPLPGITVSGDAGRLQQVLWNLLSNAIKFTPRGGRVQVLLERVDSHLEISVSDTGEGIKPEFLPFVFDRFRQADASTTRRHGGLGLGLSIVKQLVELHGGAIRIHSDGTGRGSTFVVTLPLGATRREPERDSEPRYGRTGPHLDGGRERGIELDGVRVLVVDDEPDARGLVKRLLEDCRAVVTTAASAQEALMLLRAEAFDVLVSDIGMPGEDGYSLIGRVRAMGKDRGGDIPAIALTAYARAEDRTKAITAGFLMHMTKPIEPVELLTTVAGLASRAHR
ncbi:MAG TPA: ATP-binding protein [Tepidisphaeraceae bacterium]|jgi:hypothetical protein